MAKARQDYYVWKGAVSGTASELASCDIDSRSAMFGRSAGGVGVFWHAVLFWLYIITHCILKYLGIQDTP